MKQHKVIISIPTYDGRLDGRLISAVLKATARHSWCHQVGAASLLTRGFNELWSNALTLRDKGQVTHFAMLHADVVPDAGWLDVMLDEMDRVGADVLSAVVPIKTQHGLTSTAIDEGMPDCDPHWRVRRLTLTEAHLRDETFTHPKLLINTGLMLVDFRKPWVESIHFRFEDRIERVATAKGFQWNAQNVPEDWAFSRDARAFGASLWATRKVGLVHVGTANYPNSSAWGTLKTDEVSR